MMSNLKEGIHLHEQHLELAIGEWQYLFDSTYVKSVISIALNYCVSHSLMIINGYWITDESLYLVMKSDRNRFDVIQQKMEHYIGVLLYAHCDNLRNQKQEDASEKLRESIKEALLFDLFKVYPLKNDSLIKLITGRKVDLPYFDKELEDLKNKIRHSDFCSEIDYSGAEGPVIVVLL